MTATTAPAPAKEPKNPKPANRRTSAPRKRKQDREEIGTTVNIITGRRERIVLYVILIILALLFAFPLYAAIVKSLEVDGIGNYISLFTDPLGSVPIWQTYVNSFLTGIVQAIIVIFVCVTAGYAFSKLHFRGRDIGYSAVLLFLAIPGVSILVPVYEITQTLGLFNSYIGVGLPEAAITIPFGVLLMRNYARNVPDSLSEAAEIDGAGHFRVFWSIFLPLSRPAVVNLAVLCLIWSIQDFLWPSFLFTDPNLTTAALAVQRYSNVLGEGAQTLARYNASLVLLAVPALIVVLFGLRFIVNGITSGALKD
jgi:raffinose/stachyose/melibiose transport system permease protein